MASAAIMENETENIGDVTEGEKSDCESDTSNAIEEADPIGNEPQNGDTLVEPPIVKSESSVSIGSAEVIFLYIFFYNISVHKKI